MQPQDTVLIPLRARDGSVRAYAIVDAADADWVNQWTWRTSRAEGGYGYAIRYVRSRFISMHREIMGLVDAGPEIEVDHINRDRLDNRRENLRAVTHAQNMQNRTAKATGVSVHRGVWFCKRKRKWRAEVKFRGTRYNLGYFASEMEAARVAANKRREVMTHSQEHLA